MSGKKNPTPRPDPNPQATLILTKGTTLDDDTHLVKRTDTRGILKVLFIHFYQ